MVKGKKPFLSSAIWPGIVLGLLSTIPYVNYGNCLCCLWIVGGGFLAALIFKQEWGSITPGEGAIVGLVAGLIGAAVQAVGAGILGYFFRDMYLSSLLEIYSAFEIDMAMQEMMANFIFNPVLLMTITLVSSLIANSIFATVGGLIGGAVFKEKQSPAPPAAPPEFDQDELDK